MPRCEVLFVSFGSINRQNANPLELVKRGIVGTCLKEFLEKLLFTSSRELRLLGGQVEKLGGGGRGYYDTVARSMAEKAFKGREHGKQK